MKRTAVRCHFSLGIPKKTPYFIKHVIAHSKYRMRVFRMDQGREFSRKMTDYLEGLGIEHNKNSAYTPQYQGKAERYHRTMKEKCCAYWKLKASLEELDYDLKL